MSGGTTTWTLWLLEPWLWFAGFWMFLLVLSLVASYAWTTRPSGRSPDRRPSLWLRIAPLAVLVVPALLAIGFLQLLLPVARPEVLLLRSQALRPGDTHVPAPCLQQVLVRMHDAAPPACLDAHLPGTLESDTDAKLLADVASALKPEERALDSPTSPTTVKAFREKLATRSTATVAGAGASPSGRSLDKLAVLLGLRVTWWELAGQGRLMDVTPVVKRALEHYAARQVSDLEFRQRSPAVIDALQSAVERAVGEVAPLHLQRNDASPPPPKTQGVGVEVIEAIEVAVLRLLVTERNVAAVLVEHHPRADESATANAWRNLQETLLGARVTANGRPLGLAMFPGSRIPAATYVDIVDTPWVRPLPSGDALVHAHLRFHKQPEKWVLSLPSGPDDSPTALEFACTKQGTPNPGSAPRQAAIELSHCVPDALAPGEGAVLSLVLRQNQMGMTPRRLRIDFPVELPVTPVEVPVVGDESASVSIAVDGVSTPLESTLACLLGAGSPVSGSSSIDAFRRALGDGGGAAIVPGGTHSRGAAVRIVTAPEPAPGVWIRPKDMKWSRVKDEIIGAGLSSGRVQVLSAELAAGGLLYGTPLFPVAFEGPGLPSGIRPLIGTPLAPRRSGPLLPGDNPFANLQLPAATRLLHPNARPVAWSALPRLHATSNVSVLRDGTAPLAWRIDLGPDEDGDPGGLVWFFDVQPSEQGLLLPAGCHPQWKDQAFFCASGNGPALQVYEPGYDEQRFFTVWLALLRAARASAVEPSTAQASSSSAERGVPAFVTPEMVSRARIASSSGGLLFLSIGLLGHASLLLWMRFRQRRH